MRLRKRFPHWLERLQRDPDLWPPPKLLPPPSPLPLPPPQLLTEQPNHQDWLARMIKANDGRWYCERRLVGLNVTVTLHETWEEAWEMSVEPP